MRTFGTHRPMTYAALEQALKQLGFTKTELTEPAAVFFDHPATQASLVFPQATPNEMVTALDLITARYTVIEKGIASLERYTAVVSQASRANGNRFLTARRRRNITSGRSVNSSAAKQIAPL